MFVQRLFPTRWASIVAWTAAAVAWSTALVAIQASTPTIEAVEPTPEVAPPVANVEVASMPTLPGNGLTIIRFSPVNAPPPEVIVRTVVQAPARSAAPSAPAAALPPSSGS